MSASIRAAIGQIYGYSKVNSYSASSIPDAWVASVADARAFKMALLTHNPIDVVQREWFMRGHGETSNESTPAVTSLPEMASADPDIHEYQPTPATNKYGERQA